MEYHRPKVLTYVGASLIALLAISVILSVGSNMKTRKTLNNEKIGYEKLLSEKLTGEKELEKIRADFASLKKQSDANAKLLADNQVKMAQNDKKLASLTGENRSLRADRKELEELKIYKNELEKASAQLKSDNDRLTAQTKDLQSSLTSLELEKNRLASQLENALKTNSDNFLLTATRGKNSQTIVIKASRTKKLNLTFEVPQNLTEALSFKIITPAGQTLDPDENSLTWNFPLDSRNLTASLSTVSGVFEKSRPVELNYVPEGKLAKGEYKIQIFCDGTSIGSCRIILK